MEKTNLSNPVVTEEKYEQHVFGMKRDKFLSDLDALDTMLSNWVIGESNDKVFTLLLGRKISEIKSNCIIKGA